MSYFPLRLLFLLGLCSAALGSQAQETASYSRPQGPPLSTVYVLNSTIIINGALEAFTAQDSKRIEKMMVYKGADSPSAQDMPPHLKDISAAGLIDITSPKRIPSKSFPRLGRQLGVRGPIRFAVNGYLLNESAVATLRIAAAAIAQVHIVRPTPEMAETRVDVWLALPPKTDSRKYPAGSIFIR